MEHKTSSNLASLLKIAPVAVILTGAAVVWTLLAGIIPSLLGLLFNCLLGALIFFLMYQHFKHDNDPWLSSVLRPLPTLVFVAGIFVAREALYPSSGMGVDVQIFTMASFVFFGLLLGLRERVKSRKLQ